jgi:hypothetical protein
MIRHIGLEASLQTRGDIISKIIIFSSSLNQLAVCRFIV